MKPTLCLLDTSFLIDLEDEVIAGKVGPATRTLAGLGKARLYVSPVTVAEIIEGAEDPLAAERALFGYRHITIGWAAARRCAVLQHSNARRMGENDAWQAALASAGAMTLIGHGSSFAGRTGFVYLDHRAA